MIVDVCSVLDRAVAELPVTELPDLIGALEATKVRAMVRLTAPTGPTSSDATEWVTASDVARRFNLSVSTVHELSRMGKLPCRMFGRYRRFNLAEVCHNLDEVGIRGRKAA